MPVYHAAPDSNAKDCLFSEVDFIKERTDRHRQNMTWRSA